MKNVNIFSMIMAVLFFSIAACSGESEEEKQARLKAYQDSLRAVEQAKIAEMMAQMEDSSANEMDSSEEMADETESEMSSADGSFTEDGSYVVQVGAWRSEEKAQSFVDSWADRNYPNAYVVQTGNEMTGDVWFRVRVGNFGSKEDAEAFGAELSQELNSGYWVASKD